MNNSGFYVYVYYDASGIPIYVGKGRGKRARSHVQDSGISIVSLFHAKLVDMRQSKQQWEFRIAKEGMTESAALQLEASLIRKHGRVCLGTGTLYNSVAPGDGQLQYFLKATRPIGQIDAKTGLLVKRYAYVYSTDYRWLPLKRVRESGFDSDEVKWVLYRKKKQHGGFAWDWLPRTEAELRSLREEYRRLRRFEKRRDASRAKGIINVTRQLDSATGTPWHSFTLEVVTLHRSFRSKYNSRVGLCTPHAQRALRQQVKEAATVFARFEGLDLLTRLETALAASFPKDGKDWYGSRKF